MTRRGWGAMWLLLLLARPAAAADVIGYLAEYSDVVESPRHAVLLQSHKPKDIHVGDTIVTKDAAPNQGRARAFFQDSQTVLIAGNTELFIGSYDTPDGMRSTRIRIDPGRIRVFAKEGTACRVETPAADITCTGTDFIVVVDPRSKATDVYVISGSVAVRGVGEASGTQVAVHAYQLAHIAPGQAPSRPTVPAQAAVNPYMAGLEVVGQATSERLAFGGELLDGTRVLIRDRPDRAPVPRPWGDEYAQEEPGTLGQPLFGVPGALIVEY
jgi:hypothetical protein